MGCIALSVLVLFMMLNDGRPSCAPCPKTPCLPLADEDDCHPTRTPCGCCEKCAGLEGDKCGPFLKRCHPDLVCINDKGEEKQFVKWWESFTGICSDPDYYDDYYDEYYDEYTDGENTDVEYYDGEYYYDEYYDEYYDYNYTDYTPIKL